MRKSLFEYRDYKRYLADAIEQMPNHGRGVRSKIAEILGCHIAYISQVLNGSAQLSLEQADVLNTFLGHTEAESDFFLLLLQLSRAGTKSLESYYQKKINEMLSKRDTLKNRLQFDKVLPVEIQPIYYSAWYYAALHIALAIPSLQTKDALATHFSLPLSLVSQVLEFLVSNDLAIQKGSRYTMGASKIHLGSDSGMIAKHHTNWKIQTLQSLDRNNQEELHYSSVIVLEEKIVPLVREILVRAIEEVRKSMKPSSKNEKLYCYSIDFFEIGGTKQFQKVSEKGKSHEVSKSTYTH